MVRHFHTDEWSPGVRQRDGTHAHVCGRRTGHPGDVPWHWLEAPSPTTSPGLTGLAEDLDLQHELPAAIAALGEGWFEYGLVERSYARRRPRNWRQMVEQWGHTAIAPTQCSASSYLAGTIGRLSRLGAVAYHPGVGTGRWSYNSDTSWWSALPPGPWEERTAWVDAVGDHDEAARSADAECHSYVLGPDRGARPGGSCLCRATERRTTGA
jgi:hypothetical protein